MLLSQLRRGVLQYCVLALLIEERMYAYDVVRGLGALQGLAATEGTIYPLLSRLRRDGWLDSTWVPSDAGPPRRYYAVTPRGAQELATFVADWRRFRDAVDELLPDEKDR